MSFASKLIRGSQADSWRKQCRYSNVEIELVLSHFRNISQVPAILTRIEGGRGQCIPWPHGIDNSWLKGFSRMKILGLANTMCTAAIERPDTELFTVYNWELRLSTMLLCRRSWLGCCNNTSSPRLLHWKISTPTFGRSKSHHITKDRPMANLAFKAVISSSSG